MRWTDIEIRKYRLGSKIDDDTPLEEEDDDLPPLEAGAAKESAPKSEDVKMTKHTMKPREQELE